MTRHHGWYAGAVLVAVTAAGGTAAGQTGRPAASSDFADSHFHLTNYVQEGTDVRDFLRIMGTRAVRSTLVTSVAGVRSALGAPTPRPPRRAERPRRARGHAAAPAASSAKAPAATRRRKVAATA